MARDRGLDLMEVSPNSQPPVCKICDYGKFKYEKKKKDQQAKKKQTIIKVKEIQLRPQTEEHDLEYKFRNVRQFLEDGDKAKISILFRGREITYLEQGYKMMKQLLEQVQDVSIVEAPAKLEGKKLIMVLAPMSHKSTKSPTSAISPIVKKSPIKISPAASSEEPSSSESDQRSSAVRIAGGKPSKN